VLILGINAWHPDAAACVVHDSRILAAAEEERFTREKHCTGFPAHAVNYCLQEAGAELSDLDAVALNSAPGANAWPRLRFAIASAAAPSLLAERLRARFRRRDLRTAFSDQVGDLPRRIPIARIEHHRAHMASAFGCAPFERTAVASVDGFGDFASVATGEGSGASLRIHDRVLFPHSLGIFYQAFTQFLGFPAYGDEYKVMGLAAYGEPTFAWAMERVLRLCPDGGFALDLRYFRHHRIAICLDAGGGAPHFPALLSDAVTEILGLPRCDDEPVGQRHRDLAHSVQQRYEQALFHVLDHLQQRSGHTDLALAGGCAMNSVANGKIYARTRFTRLFVQPAAGDAGGALGAALCAQRDIAGTLPRTRLRHAALGPAFDDERVARAIESAHTELDAAGCVRGRVRSQRELCKLTAAAIARGEVVGWFQGRMEWGPRALGQRSILADPRRDDMRDLLNYKIKRREGFRPFAPSILREAVAEWFEVDDEVPFMMKVFALRAERREQVPAVSHVDGSARLHTVDRTDNELYHRLIACFARETGVPMLLNTSFNENEPIVCRPEEALECFLRTRMDRLVMGTHVLTRSQDPPSQGDEIV
jgi:carbamoyltransferase